MSDLSSPNRDTSTGLGRLYQAIDGRTKGEWRQIREGSNYLRSTEAEDGFANTLDGTWVADAYEDKDRDFIALIGSCADEIKAVLQTLDDSRATWGLRPDVDRALSALAARLRQLAP